MSSGVYRCRGLEEINIQRRLVYEVHADKGVVHVLRMWTH